MNHNGNIMDHNGSIMVITSVLHTLITMILSNYFHFHFFFSVLLGLSHISKLHLISFLNKTFIFFSHLNCFYQSFSDIKIVSFLRYQSDFRQKSQSHRSKYTPISDLKKGMLCGTQPYTRTL